MDFTLYWLDGKKEIITGDCITDALRNSGLGSGAVKALDFWSGGICNKFEWVTDKRNEHRKHWVGVRKEETA